MLIFPVMLGGNTHTFFEKPGKIKLIRKTNIYGYILNRKFCLTEKFFRPFNAEMIKIIHRCMVCIFTKNSYKMAFTNIDRIYDVI